MPTARELREEARSLRVQANNQPTAEAGLAFRARAAWLDRRADELEAKMKASAASWDRRHL